MFPEALFGHNGHASRVEYQLRHHHHHGCFASEFADCEDDKGPLFEVRITAAVGSSIQGAARQVRRQLYARPAEEWAGDRRIWVAEWS